MVCCGQNGIAPLGQNGIMMSHCIGFKNIKMQFVLSSHANNISLTLFSRCTSLIVMTSKIPVRWPGQCYGFTLSLIFKYCGGI